MLTPLQWSKSTKLIRSWEGSFSTTLKFPWESRILFKYIVDGQWVTSRHEKTETDANGNVNNVFRVPPKPEPNPTAPAPTAVKTETASAPAPSEPEPQPVTATSVKDAVVETLTSVKDSVLATVGAHLPNVTGNVASAVGAVITTATGVDPVSAPKVSS
jgi:Glycogen recognition site of AMP-activated protein kinase